MHKYIFTLRGHLEGPQVQHWYKVTADEKEMKAVIFGITMSAKLNMCTNILVLNSERSQVTIDEFQEYLRTLRPAELAKFIKDASLESNDET